MRIMGVYRLDHDFMELSDDGFGAYTFGELVVGQKFIYPQISRNNGEHGVSEKIYYNLCVKTDQETALNISTGTSIDFSDPDLRYFMRVIIVE